MPSHDPEEYVDSSELCDEAISATVVKIQPLVPETLYSPYPNRSSFLLGDWYWSDGAQKSRESFCQLIRIIGNPDFRPEDVQHTSWNKIDADLGRNNFDGSVEGGEEEWMEEDAGWHRTPITISVPFHRRTKAPGATCTIAP